MPRQKNGRRKQTVPTIADVAKRAGVSPMTVSRVINGEDNVRQSTRETVNRAVDELGYTPNQAARSLAGADQIRIGMFYDDARTSYVSMSLVAGLQQASKRNVQLSVARSASIEEGEEAIRRLALGGIDGVVLPPPLSDSERILDLLQREEIATVIIATGDPNSPFSAVGVDDFEAAHAMVDHIISLGHKRIGFITGALNQMVSKRRLNGYKDALQNAGIEVDESLIVEGEFTYKSGLGAARTLLSLDPMPTAIFASNDEMAAATIAVAHRRGIDVPNDITVCGFDDTAVAVTVWPELTTIRQPIEEMCRTAVDHLIDKIRARRAGKKPVREQIVLDFTLVPRSSDAGPRRAT